MSRSRNGNVGLLAACALFWSASLPPFPSHASSQLADSPPGVNALAPPDGTTGGWSAECTLQPGEMQSIPAEEIQRVAISDPAVADIEVISGRELFLQARAVGSTNLIIWDQKGRRVLRVNVVDRAPEQVEAELRALVRQLGLDGVRVYREREKLFLTGQVAQQEDVERVERILSAFRSTVTNLVTLAPQPPRSPTPSVKLTVQVLEITRDATDKFGVDWIDSLTFTETTFGATGPSNTSLRERVEDAFRIGAITRSSTAGSLSAVLNLLVSQGKARLLAEPKLVAASGKEATTFLGVEVPVITTTSVSSGTVSQSIEFKNTGVELQFQPTVLEGDRSIQLAINAKVSSIDSSVGITVSGILVPGFRIRQTHTEIVTSSGQSVLISGLLQDEEKKNISQIPGIGSVPVLGNLFRSTNFVRGQTELIVVVTPELVGANDTASLKRDALVEQAFSSAEHSVLLAEEEARRRYVVQVQDRVAASVRYPTSHDVADVGGRVTLRLHVLRDGTLAHALIASSSGVSAFDAEALHAAQHQSPYPVFPPGLSQSDLWLELPIEFRP